MNDRDDMASRDDDGHFAAEMATYDHFASEHARVGTPIPRRSPFLRRAIEGVKADRRQDTPDR